MSDVFDPKDVALDPKTAHKAVKEIKQQLKAFAKSEKESLKEMIRRLSPAQRDALARKLAGEKAAAEPAGEREPAEIMLSFAQEREWFRDRMFPGVAHNIAGALRLEGPLAIEALRSTLDEIVRRHDALRARITAPEGKPVVAIAPPLPVRLEIVDTNEESWPDLYAGEMTRGFDLERDLLLRATLLRLGHEQHILLLTLHHIAADGWSIGVAMQELAELYTAFVESRRSSLPPVSMQYSDFARWQRERMEGESLRAGLAYWQEQLAGLPPVLELPPDRLLHGDPLTERDHDAATTASRIDAVTRQALESLSRSEDTTLFVTLLTAFVVLLGRCTGREDVLVGSPVSGRTRVETERSIGLFLNTLALRVRLAPELTFRQALAITRIAVLGALEHAEVPVERIVQSLDSDRGRNEHPLYETIFNFTPSAPRRATWGDLRVELQDPPALIEEFSTQLFVTDAGAELDLDLRFRAKRYTRERMACFLEQYVSLLEQIARDADCRIAALDLATPLSRMRIPDPTLPLGAPAHIHAHDAIEAWIARTPAAPAVQQGEVTISYAELGERIEDAVVVLRHSGFARGDVVAVTGARSIDVIVAMAATLRAGGVLLTLSTDLPARRRQVMLEEAGARFVLECGGARRGFDIAVRIGSNRRCEGDAAYIFFTSGSTGTPKAVLGTHAGLAHWLAWQRETFEVGPGDRCGQLTGLSFDVVLRDVFLALTSGATLVLPTAGDNDTLRWLDRERITLTHTVPAVAETWLINKPADVTLAALRRIFFAGEPLTSSLVARWRDAFPKAGTIVNIYGPTETTLAKCFYVVPEQLRAGVQPLGRTLPQTQALVLTPERTLCGVGEPGEIAIRTPFRSRGYLNTDEENGRRFVVNPFTGEGEDLLYLTGDRGVYNAEGLLEFGGRIDQQVKIRGVRIEPMEVSAALQSVPSVAACAVIARDDGRGPMLVAYVVLAKDAAEDAAALQEALAQRLPAAMIPSAFVFLEALPLTANQKLDRDRLPPPSSASRSGGPRYIAPRDAVELTLVQIWEELLDVRPIGVTHRFFEVGGHSLLALRLLVEIERRLGSKVPLPALFEEPTIEHLAKTVRRKDDAWPLMVTLRTGAQRRKLFLVHPGGGTLLNYVHLLRHLPAGIPIHGIQARGLDGRHEPHAALEEMARDYVAELRRVQAEGPYLVAGHSFGGVIAFEMARQLENAGETVAFLGMFDSVAPVFARGHAPEDEQREDALRLASMAEGIGRFLGEKVEVSFPQLACLPADQQIEAVVDALVRTRALPPGEEQKLIRNLLAVSKAHVRAHRAYVPQRIATPITLFRVDEAKASDYPSSDEALLREEALGWTGFTNAVRVVRTSGNHITMLDSTHAKGLAELLGVSLAEALEWKGEDHVQGAV